MSTYKNIAIVWQPHFMTHKVRASVENQKGQKHNYVIICCSPSNNGMYIYPAELTRTFGLVDNNGRMCYEVPMSVLKKVSDLEDIKEEDIRKEIIKQQKKSLKNKKEKSPDWLLK